MSECLEEDKSHKSTYNYANRIWGTKSIPPQIQSNRSPNLHLSWRKPKSAAFALRLQTVQEGEKPAKGCGTRMEIHGSEIKISLFQNTSVNLENSKLQCIVKAFNL